MPVRMKRSLSHSVKVLVTTLVWGATEVLALSRSRQQRWRRKAGHRRGLARPGHGR